MDRLDDFRLGSEPEPPPGQEPDRSSRTPIWIAAFLLAIAAVVAGVIVLRRPGPPPPSEPAAQATAAPQTDAREPLGPVIEPIELPPLVLTDPLVRELLGRLSSSPTLASWLATDGLIRAFVVSVENVADGSSPARHVRALAPRSPFRTLDESGAITIDPRSYSRYDGMANAAAALDAAGLAQVYSTLKPRLVEAYKELGHPEGALDVAVERAIAHLLQTPVVEEPVALRPRVLSFRYERADLEALSPAQKQLLRMGPRNVRIVQDQLRAVARELGIPLTRLPPRAEPPG
ncbi:MAG: DUF3014 domain-containing protein [Vicinamibacterales bacterium]